MVNGRHWSRVKALLDDALAHGARAVVGGESDESDKFIQPTLLDNIGASAKIMEEEIFGPLLPILTYTNIDEVITVVNRGPKPLALYIYSSRRKTVDKVLGETVSGGAVVNGSLIQFLHINVPFGGIGNSGQGNVSLAPPSLLFSLFSLTSSNTPLIPFPPFHSPLFKAHGIYGFKAFSHERAVIKVKLSLLTGLFSAGIMPNWQRRVFQTGFKWF